MGVCSYDTRTVRWLETLRTHYDGRVILVMTSDYPDGLEAAYEVEIRRVSVDAGFWENRVGLGCYQWQYIQPVAAEFPDAHILRTDVFDVIFQDDPRKYVDYGQDWIYIEQEGMLNRDNEYMMGWFSISPDVEPAVFQQPVYNVGVICARGRQLADIAAFIGQRRGRTYADQTELAIYMRAHPDAFCSVPLFFSHFADMLAQIQIADARYFVNKENRQKYCVCHANGKTTHYLDSLYPPAEYADRFEIPQSLRFKKVERELTIGIPVKDRPVELALLLQSLKPDLSEFSGAAGQRLPGDRFSERKFHGAGPDKTPGTQWITGGHHRGRPQRAPVLRTAYSGECRDRTDFSSGRRCRSAARLPGEVDGGYR